MRRKTILPLALLFAGLLGMGLILGLDTVPKLNVAINYKVPTHQMCSVFNRDVQRGCVEVQLLYSPYGNACVYPQGSAAVATALGGVKLNEYLRAYDVGSQHPCYYPSEDVGKITFDSPARVDGLLFSFTILLPFVLMTMVSFVLLLRVPKPHFDTMVQRTEKLIATHDKKMKKQNEDNLKEIAVLRGKIEREQEKRLQFVTELTQERGERIRQYDDLKDDLIKDFSRVEDKLGLRKGEVSGSSLIPGSYSERTERRKKTPLESKAKSQAGGLIDFANQTKRRQSTAIDAERQRQDDLFKKRLAERRKKNQL